MKNFLIVALFGLLTIWTSNSQVSQENSNKQAQELYDYHMTKSKNAKTAGWIMLGAGIGMTIAGIGINLSGGIIDSDSTNNDKGIWLSYLGGITTIASVPLFISAGKNKKKSKLFLINSISSLNSPDFKNIYYTSVSLTILL